MTKEKNDSPLSREALIQKRQKESIYWWIIHQLGSLKLAMTLLLTIALACAVATFAESTFNTKVAQAYIYQAAWFNLWLVILCVNLFAVTLTRWPWLSKHTGFIITHYGIIILLAGALAGRIWGFEGNVVLDKNKPVGRIISNRTILQLDSPKDLATYITPIDIALHPPSPENPRLMHIPDSRDRILLTGYTENMQVRPVMTVAENDAGAPAGINLRMQSAMMGQSFDIALWLQEGAALDSHNLAGLADIRIVPGLPVVDERKRLKPGEAIPFSENQIVFAKSPESTVIDNSWGRPSGYILTYLFDDAKKSGSLRIVSPADVESVMDIPRKLPGKKTLEDGTVLTVTERWTDFAIIKGRPANDGNQNQNPALLVNIEGKISPGPQASRSLPSPELLLAVQPGGQVLYQVRRGQYVTASGEISKGESILPGWADWSVTLDDAFPHAIPAGQNVILSPEQAANLDPKQFTPALEARIRAADGREGPTQWIPSGEVITLAGPDGQPQRVGFGLQARQVPFLITLLNFEVPRREGTSEPADFIATIRFNHLKTGQSSTQISKMNHPASFPNEWWRPFTGITYKFSQAQWDPNNLDQTTMQVLYDPGWFLKWIGSLGICIGIFIMFYCKPYARKTTENTTDAPVSATPEISKS